MIVKHGSGPLRRNLPFGHSLFGCSFFHSFRLCLNLFRLFCADRVLPVRVIRDSFLILLSFPGRILCGLLSLSRNLFLFFRNGILCDLLSRSRFCFFRSGSIRFLRRFPDLFGLHGLFRCDFRSGAVCCDVLSSKHHAVL